MHLKIFLLAFILVIFSANQAFSQLSFTSPNALKGLVLVSEQGEPKEKGKLSSVHLKVELKIDSEVKVEIRDALGMKLFESMAVYPEGEQEVKVSIGDMSQGLYFVKLLTEFEEKTEMLLIEK